MTKHIVEYTTYKFEELNDDAQEQAIKKNRDMFTNDSFWSDCTIDDIKDNVAPYLGIEIENIYFSGFSSQGDGAMFEGRYEYKKGTYRNVVKEFPSTWKETKESGEVVEHECKSNIELHSIALKLQQLQRRNFYQLSATTKHKGYPHYYYHEGMMSVEVYDNRDHYGSSFAEIEEELTDILRSFANWIYNQLESEYEYQTSNEVIRENLIANEFEFTEEGKIV